MLKKRESIWFLTLIAGIYVYAWYLQSSISLNCDVSWLILAAKRLWLGGNYVDDFFETNPPLIMYLYLPSHLIHHLISFSPVTAIRLYILGLISVSLILCFLLLQKIFECEHQRLFHVFFIALTCTFLLIPIGSFGQREHLAIVLIMPYVFLTALRLESKLATPAKSKSLNLMLACVIGFIAGVGFSIKPFFYFTFLLIELYVRSWHKRPELIVSLCTIMLYALLLFIFHREYISVIVPFSMRTYYQGNYDPLYDLLHDPCFLFCLFSIFLPFIPNTRYKYLTPVLTVTMIGFIAAHFGQHILLYYHLLPAYFCAILLLVLTISCAALPTVKSAYFYVLMAALALLVLVYFYTKYNTFWTFVVIAPFVFFTYFFFIFMLTSYLFGYQKNKLIMCVSIGTVISIAAIFSYCFQFTDWFSHRFGVTLIMLFFLFALSTPSNISIKINTVFHAIFCTLAFTFVFYFYYNSHQVSIYADKMANPFLDFFKKNPQYHSIYALANSYGFTFNAVNELGLSYVSRFPFFWMAPVLSERPNQNPQHITDKEFFVNMVASDIKYRKPDIIFVDVANPKFKSKKFNYDYLIDFSKHPTFKSAFMHYHYLTEIYVPSFYGNGYRYAIYARH